MQGRTWNSFMMPMTASPVCSSISPEETSSTTDTCSLTILKKSTAPGVHSLPSSACFGSPLMSPCRKACMLTSCSGSPVPLDFLTAADWISARCLPAHFMQQSRGIRYKAALLGTPGCLYLCTSGPPLIGAPCWLSCSRKSLHTSQEGTYGEAAHLQDVDKPGVQRRTHAHDVLIHQ